MSAVCAACSGSTWHRDGCRFEDTISDGFGSEWAKCRRPDCGLHVVRPGKAQCDCEEDASDNPAEDAQEGPGAPQTGDYRARPRCVQYGTPDKLLADRDAYVDTKRTGQPYGWERLSARERVLVRALYKEIRRRSADGSIFMARCELFRLVALTLGNVR